MSTDESSSAATRSSVTIVRYEQKHCRRSSSAKAKDNLVHGISTIKDVKETRFQGVYLVGFRELRLPIRRTLIMSDQAGVVIKDDLKFVGQCVQIVSQNKIEIDCEFEGDVTGPEVVVSERDKVSGFVAGDRVTVLGKVVGGIRGKTVALMSSARVEGEIHHNSLVVEKGAELTGRCSLNEASTQSFG